MIRQSTLSAVGLALALTAAVPPKASLAECSPPPDYVGVAAMLPDSTIVVEVMFQGCLDGEDVVGHDMREVRPEDPF